MQMKLKFFLLTFMILAVTVNGASNTQAPNIGYLYPAGAQKGTTVKIKAAGQFLRQPKEVHISGEGVTAKVITHCNSSTNNLNPDTRRYYTAKINELIIERINNLPPGIRNSLPGYKEIQKKLKAQKTKNAQKKPQNQKFDLNPETNKRIKLQKDPLLDDLESKSLRELEHIRSQVFMPQDKLQPNRQLAELVVIEITVAEDAVPGNRELRIETAQGISNPIVFQVSTAQEIYEIEPNNRLAYQPLPRLDGLPKPAANTLPAVFNGQIRPGDIDRFRFKAEKGQKLVIQAHARNLIPYLADAVPGWFQATITLYDGSNRKAAFADDYKFNPDPVMYYEIDKNSEYEIEIRDSIYRGREDFVYRIEVGTSPFITAISPLGGKENVKTEVGIKGWNLQTNSMPIDTSPNGPLIRHTALIGENTFSNSVAYIVDDIPEFTEKELAEQSKNAIPVKLPVVINGKIDKPGDIDIYSFEGKKGDRIIAEVFARRLNSPLDSILRLTDDKNNHIELNDDHVLKDQHLHKDSIGLITHHADSYLQAELPETGKYKIHIADTQNHGDGAHNYRLRISPPQPDFEIRITPSSLTIPADGIAPIRFHILRKDGFNDPIELKVPAGFKLHCNTIPAGKDTIDMTLQAPPNQLENAVSLKITAKAAINNKVITKTVIPADDTMQAFLYRHLVPAKELLTVVTKPRWRVPDFIMPKGTPVVIAPSGTAEVVLQIPNEQKRWLPKNFSLEIHKGPKGMTIEKIESTPKSLKLTLKASDQVNQNSMPQNLLIEITGKNVPKKNNKNSKKMNTWQIGFLPAIPVLVKSGM